MDCGPSCLRMIAKHFTKDLSLEALRDRCFITKVGVSLLGISQAAEKIGFRSLAVKVGLAKLKRHRPFPCILHWNQNHFVVLYQIKKGKYFIADPAHGLFPVDETNFIK